MIDLNDLSAGMPGLTPALGTAMAEAGAVCLEHNGHTRGAQITVRGNIQNVHTLDWPAVTSQMRRTWADLREATETGAEGIAILLIKQVTDYTVIERAAIGTQIDRWLGHEADAPYFQRKARLENTGILRGDDGQIRQRLREKLERLAGGSQLPAYVVVIEFSRPVAEVDTK